LAAWTENESHFPENEQRRQALFLLWRATGDRRHLLEAKRLLDEVVAQVDEATRGLLLTKLYRNREIVEACRAEGIG
jgi:hypothetical protein